MLFTSLPKAGALNPIGSGKDFEGIFISVNDERKWRRQPRKDSTRVAYAWNIFCNIKWQPWNVRALRSASSRLCEMILNVIKALKNLLENEFYWKLFHALKLIKASLRHFTWRLELEKPERDKVKLKLCFGHARIDSFLNPLRTRELWSQPALFNMKRKQSNSKHLQAKERKTLDRLHHGDHNYQHYLERGTGNACAWHNNAMFESLGFSNKLILDSVLKTGALNPTGSAES